MIDLPEMVRYRKTAATWFAKAAGLLTWNHERLTGEQKWLAGYEVSQLLEDVLGDAEELVALIPEEFVEDVEERARALSGALRSRRLAAKLENVEGRTPQEAETFLRKAAEIRESVAAGRGGG